jgi:3-methyladenine DNA glycosylase/8-oxoguanine DNA glycosylase
MTRRARSPEAYLAKACPHMARVVKLHPPFPRTPNRTDDPYPSLVRAVVFQQLSGKAAQTILSRVLAFYPHTDFPSPEELIETPPERLREAGLSRQKIAAVKDIAAKRLDGTIPEAPALAALCDEDVIARLTAARGVGRWTVEMHLIFAMGRPDVWPIDDLGVRKGAERITGETFTPKTLGAYGARWAPHRSAAAWHCWRALEIVTP